MSHKPAAEKVVLDVANFESTKDQAAKNQQKADQRKDMTKMSCSFLHAWLRQGGDGLSAIHTYVKLFYTVFYFQRNQKSS